MTRRALRPFWWAYWPCVILVVLGVVLGSIGPRVQSTFAPIHTALQALQVTRSTDRLCWDFASVKMHEASTDDLDTFLYVAGRDRMVVAPIGAVDGMPWRASRAPKIGPFRKRWCVELPDGVPDWQPVRFELTTYYRGPWGLWRVPLVWPPVEAAGMIGAPAIP